MLARCYLAERDLESCVLEKAPQRSRIEARLPVAVLVGDRSVSVRGQGYGSEGPSRPQDARGFGHDAVRGGGIRERVHEQDLVKAHVRKRKRVHVANVELNALQVCEPLVAGSDDPMRNVEAVHFSRPRSDQLGQRPVARGHIEDALLVKPTL